jgi:hydrogenase maturation protein HypF
VLSVLQSKEQEILRSKITVEGIVQKELTPLLAVGGEMKNTICLTRGKTAFLSRNIGEMGYQETYELFLKTIEYMKQILKIDPQAIACDLHPGYSSTNYAYSQKKLPVLEIQHHHAHIASCLAENGINEKVIGVSFDGAGYGIDGKVWGGEFLLADYMSFKRVAHLAYLPLPGGERAIQEPWRMALSYLDTFSESKIENLDLELLHKRKEKEVEIILKLIRSQFNSPLTSSMGRLFDAVSALLGICEKSTFEGQAAIELEMAMDGDTNDYYSFLYQKEGRCQIINPSPLIRGILSDLKENKSLGYVSSKFHHSIVTMVVDICRTLRDEWGPNRVALSGGCFQNTYLLSQSIKKLINTGFEVICHRKVPPNDEGLALGQALIANEILRNN